MKGQRSEVPESQVLWGSQNLHLLFYNGSLEEQQTGQEKGWQSGSLWTSSLRIFVSNQKTSLLIIILFCCWLFALGITPGGAQALFLDCDSGITPTMFRDLVVLGWNWSLRYVKHLLQPSELILLTILELNHRPGLEGDIN